MQAVLGVMRILATIIYLIIGLVQYVAIIGGLADWLGMPVWLAIILAFPIAYMPIIGTIVGIFGAITSFGWNPFFAILLFCWPFLIYLFMMLLFIMLSSIEKHR